MSDDLRQILESYSHTCECNNCLKIKELFTSKILTRTSRLESENKKLREFCREASESIKNLITYAIFISSCYQKNYNEFADYNPPKPLREMSEEEKKYYHSIADRFSTVQGFALRLFVEELSKADKPNDSMKLNQLKRSIDFINSDLYKEFNMENK